PTRRGAPEGSIVIGLVNNMPDAALHSTENQFAGLLQEASGGLSVRLRLTSLPELPRSPEALEHIRRSYWPLEELLAAPLDALIVTGTEPRAPVLRDEPYWRRFLQPLVSAREHTRASAWSSLPAPSSLLEPDRV